MKIYQYVYFALRSPTCAASTITDRLRVAPNRVMIRESSRRGAPTWHSWGVECKTQGMTVDEQVATVLRPLLHVSADIAALRQEWPDVDAVLQVVRNFDYPDGAEEDLTTLEDGAQKLAGQHQLLGWHLDRQVLDFLSVTGAELDVDEYADG